MKKRTKSVPDSGTSNKSNSKRNEVKQAPAKRITMADLDQISDDDDGPMPPEDMWDDDAKNLKKSIESGAFDNLLNETHDNDNDSVEEVDLDGSDVDDDDSDADSTDKNNNPSTGLDDASTQLQPTTLDMNVMDAEKQDNAEQAAPQPESEPITINQKNNTSSKALRSVTDNRRAEKKEWPWAETFYVTVPTQLPFGAVSSDSADIVSIHDDLKREVAFYNTTLEGVILAKAKCAVASIPFSRPDDFFAEMVKTDEHMARIKDKLIFETKKMDAVAQRKSNKEQKLRSKEAIVNKQTEKAKRKRDHFKQVEEWAQSAAANRGKNMRDNDEVYLKSMGNEGPKKSEKRKLADKKFGHGGKKGRFKQNDPRDFDSAKGFNTKGNFPGIGTKNSSLKKKNAAERKGKRARDASRGK